MKEAAELARTAGPGRRLGLAWGQARGRPGDKRAGCRVGRFVLGVGGEPGDRGSAPG